MSRLDDTFARLRARERTGLVTYVTAGDPDSARVRRDVLRALDRGGADVLEVGVPFSDPLADGPVIQRATERALAAGATLARRARAGRPDCGATSGADRALHLRQSGPADGRRARSRERAADAGVDGVLVLDLPIEEAGEARPRSRLAAST